QADSRRLPTLIKVGREPRRPWIVLVTNRDHDLILAQDIAEEQPSSDLLWNKLADAMQKPLASDPHRPRELQVRDREPWQTLRPHLEEIGVHVVPLEELDMVDAMLGELAAQMGTDEPPGLLDAPDIGPEQAGRFYEAAAAFYQQAPWKNVGYESAI